MKCLSLALYSLKVGELLSKATLHVELRGKGEASSRKCGWGVREVVSNPQRGAGRCVLTSSEGVHQSWVRVGGVSSLLFGLANLGITFSKLQSNRLWHVGVKPYALLQNCPQKGDCENALLNSSKTCTFCATSLSLSLRLSKR